jgi:hypothetical protein
MSLLSELNSLLSMLGLPVETGVFSGKAPDEYVVLTPLSDTFAVHADNLPRVEVQEVRISLFSKGNYRNRVREVTQRLLASGITVTERKYVGHEDSTDYHNYAVDAAREYPYLLDEGDV